MRIHLLASLAAAACGLAACVTTGTPVPASPVASLPPAERPVYDVGTRFTYRDGSAEIVSELVDRGAGGDTWRESSGCKWTEPEPFGPPVSWTGCDGRSGKATVGAASGSLWPLRVGNQASWSVRAPDWQTTRRCVVADTVKVTVPAGAFDAYRIVCEDDFATRTWFYSPVLAASVAYTRVHRKQGQQANYQLASLPKVVLAP